MFQKLIRKFRSSSEGPKSSPHSLPLNSSAYDIDAESLKDDASYATSFNDTKHPTLFENPNVPIQAEMLEDDNMAWVSTKTRKDAPTPPYVHPASHYRLQPSPQPSSHYVKRAEMLEEDNSAWGPTKRRKAKPASQHVGRAEMLDEDNIAWGRLPMGRKMKPASHYVERAELLEEDNRAW